MPRWNDLQDASIHGKSWGQNLCVICCHSFFLNIWVCVHIRATFICTYSFQKDICNTDSLPFYGTFCIPYFFSMCIHDLFTQKNYVIFENSVPGPTQELLNLSCVGPWNLHCHTTQRNCRHTRNTLGQGRAPVDGGRQGVL